MSADAAAVLQSCFDRFELEVLGVCSAEPAPEAEPAAAAQLLLRIGAVMAQRLAKGTQQSDDDAPEDERGVVVRAKSRAVLGTREAGLTEELLSPDISGDFEMIRSVFEPGAASGPVEVRPTQEAGPAIIKSAWQQTMPQTSSPLNPFAGNDNLGSKPTGLHLALLFYRIELETAGHNGESL